MSENPNDFVYKDFPLCAIHILIPGIFEYFIYIVKGTWAGSSGVEQMTVNH